MTMTKMTLARLQEVACRKAADPALSDEAREAYVNAYEGIGFAISQVAQAHEATLYESTLYASCSPAYSAADEAAAIADERMAWAAAMEAEARAREAFRAAEALVVHCAEAVRALEVEP